ncbi:MAG: DUF1269 domain-containing protein [Mesorhizobium sp.]|nr:MAG: DUF1269 domain-containing protein [Mesorhizobium sp.]
MLRAQSATILRPTSVLCSGKSLDKRLPNRISRIVRRGHGAWCGRSSGAPNELSRFKGRIIRSSLPPEQVARLQEALSRARASDNAPSAGSASAA